MTTSEDALWRPPPEGTPPPGSLPHGEPSTAPAAGGTPETVDYPGPPPNIPPPPGWRPEFVVEPPPPRTLPPQDHGALDVQEAAARTVTYGVGLVAGAIMLLALCALFARALF
ncbi:MAG: translation initiation factor 2 [Micromonosporaceae bacterium]